MSKRFNISLLALVIALAAFVLSGRQYEPVASAAPASSYELLSALPKSDFIIYFDTQRVLTDVIPAILVEQPEIRAKLESEIENVKKHTGVDPRLLDAVAVGLNFNSQGARGVKFSVIARGRFDANATIDAGLSAAMKESRGELTKRTQVYEGRTLNLLVPTRGSGPDRASSNENEDKISEQVMVFVALDSNTIAFGNLESVRATIDAALGRGRVDDELVQLATRTPNAAVCFSGNVPPDMAKQIRFGNKDADNTLAAMKQVYGSFSSNGNDAETNINIRMGTDDEARRVSMTLNALKMLARFGASQVSAESKSIETMIKSVEIYAAGNEVQVTAKVALSDLAPFIPKH